jgi:peptidoglycan/xylan/chitin deacetylase (PgdA/CDA1 family)
VRGKKALLGEALGRSGLATAALKLAPSGPRGLTILAYHRILDIGDEDQFPGDPELVSASVAEFERQMRFVREHFSVLSLGEVLDLMDRRAAFPRRSLVVTFDDGHIDNYTHAFPVLKALGVPATIFLSTAYIDAPHTPFWFDRVAQLLYFAPPGPFELVQLGYAATLGNVAQRRQVTGEILNRLKLEPDTGRLAALVELEDSLSGHVPREASSRRSAMTWEEVREMGTSRIEFGSHTVSHPILSRLDEAAIHRELLASRERIRSCTGQAADSLAYPVGKVGAYDERVIRAAKACGYRIGLSYETGVNPQVQDGPFALRRLAVERYVSWGHFKAMLGWPGVFA